MTLIESQCILWNICDISSSKCIESSPISILNGEYSLTMELKKFEDTQKDKFIMCLKLQKFRYITSFPFLSRTFIQDEFSNIQFFQKVSLNENYFHTGTGGKSYCIWYAKRNEILAISERLQLSCLNFVILLSTREQHHRWMNILEEKSKNQNEKDIDDKMIQTDSGLTTSSCVKSLTEDFCNLLKNEKETDTILKCGDETFPVHKTILSARSDVFAAMFRNNMSEKRDGIVAITDTDPVILKEFLQYVYAGTLSDINEDTAPLLYVTAHKYAVDALQRRCADFMEKNLTEVNACNHLILADTHGDSSLKNRVISFIIYNEKVLSGEEWFKLCDDNPKLSTEVYRAFYKNTSSTIS